MGFYTGHDNNLSNVEVRNTIFNLYNGIIDKSKNELYALLIQNNYFEKKISILYSNIAAINKETQRYFYILNNDMVKYIEEGTNITRKLIKLIIEKSKPNHLKQYVDGFTIPRCTQCIRIGVLFHLEIMV